MNDLPGALNDFASTQVLQLFVDNGQASITVVDGTHWVFTSSTDGDTDLVADPGDPESAMTEADGVLWDQGNKRITVWDPTTGGSPYAVALFV